MKSFLDLTSSRSRAAFLVLCLTTAILAPAANGQCPGASDSSGPECSTGQDTYPLPKTPPQPYGVDGKIQLQMPNTEHSAEDLNAGRFPEERGPTDGNHEVDRFRSRRQTIDRKSEPPTEFQRFVAASTGQALPIYGADLFSTNPVSFGPVDQGPAPGEMIVGAGDELRIRVWGQVNFSSNQRVNRAGEIYLPKVGTVHVAGIPLLSLSKHLRSAMEGVYRNFDLSVDLGDIHTIQIYITGLARRPGQYTVSAVSTLVDALFQSGGPSAAGSMRHVQLKRSGKILTDFDLYALLVNGDKTGDMQLQPGDVLYIPAAGPQVAVLGSVRQPAIFELRGDQSIDNLLSAAGGRTTIASEARMSLERIENHQGRRAFNITPDAAGLATSLKDGDIIRIDPIVSNYHETVTLRGAVANPGHFAWHEGMRMSEVLPDRDSLLSRDYWWRRTQLGLPAVDFTAEPGSRNRQIATDDLLRYSGGTPPIPEPSAPRSASTRPKSIVNSIQPTGQTPDEQLNIHLPASPNAQTNWNFAVVERLSPQTMTTTLIPFSLGKLVLDHDKSQDLELSPGDVITVFRQSDIQIPLVEQTKYVTLEGEFVHPGLYSVSPNETLLSVIERAGGLTKQAYIYAASFTRKSTQELEQEHLSEFADQLDRRLMRNAISSFGSGMTGNAPEQQSMTTANRDILSRVRGTHATGRIVLNLHPDATGVYQFPDMHLEDGDRLVVPFVPDTVQVLGAVPNPHAFIFRKGGTVGEYLRLAGGPNRDADRKHIFVLRADGTVSLLDSKASTLFMQNSNSIKLHPGDSVVVPEKSVHLKTMAQILAWTQAISQASLPAAEATTLAR